jgi:hypothetical protein
VTDPIYMMGQRVRCFIDVVAPEESLVSILDVLIWHQFSFGDHFRRIARIFDLSAARESIVGKLTHYKKRSTYYRSVMALVHEAFDTTTDHSLVQLNVRGLQAVCRYLGIRFDFQVCSELNLPLPTSLRPGDWAPNICSLVGATSYVNPVGGQELFDPDEFSRRGVDLYFAKTKAFSYDPSPYKYEPNLSREGSPFIRKQSRDRWLLWRRA